MVKTALTILGSLWTAPIDIPARLLFQLLSFRRHPCLDQHFRVYEVPKFLQGLFAGTQAFTLGSNIIFVERRFMQDRIFRHEVEHIKQWRILGIFFLPLYVLASIYAGIVHQDGYKKNIFEVWARRKE